MACFQTYRLVLFAPAAALVLASNMIDAAHAQPRPKDQSQAPGAPSAALLSPLAAHPLDALSATRDRPLFSPSRHPPAPPPVAIAPKAPPPSPPNVTLFGVVMDGNEARAIVQAGPAKQVRRVRVGDDVGGWKVAQIEQRRLVLSLDSRLATFTMFRGQGNPAPAVADKQRHPARPRD
jgi:general secretion pathway protein N